MKYHGILLLTLAVVALCGLVTFAANPVLYIPAKDPIVSTYHQNPAVFRQDTINSTNDIVPLMQDVIDRQKPVAVDVRGNETDTVKRDLARYDRASSALQVKIIQYNMRGGEIEPFLAGTENQRVILYGLSRQEEALNGLIAAGMRAGGDSDAKATIASQMAAGKEAERSLLTMYLDNCSAVMKISSRIGLDTRSYEEAKALIQGILQEIENAPETTPVNLTETGADRITLLIEPTTAVYGDTVQVYGIATPAQKNQSVVILLDNTPFTTGTTDATGNYYSRFMVERISGGNHSIAARTGNITSPQKILGIRMSGTTTTLNAEPGYRNNSEAGVYCDGTVMAGQPVRNAPVTLLAEGDAAMTIMTAENGTFREFLPLSGGSHSVTAQFSADGYPLNPSSSSPVSVVVPATPIRLVDLLGVAIVFFGILGVAYLWLIRRMERKTSPVPESEDGGLDSLLSDTASPLPADPAELPPEIGTLFARYQAILKEQGLSDAARKAYLDLAARIATHLRLPSYRTLTPRELSGTCTTKSYGGIIDIFVDSYERIRYGGSTKQQDKTGFEQELKAADTETGRKQA